MEEMRNFFDNFGISFLLQVTLKKDSRPAKISLFDGFVVRNQFFFLFIYIFFDITLWGSIKDYILKFFNTFPFSNFSACFVESPFRTQEEKYWRFTRKKDLTFFIQLTFTFTKKQKMNPFLFVKKLVKNEFARIFQPTRWFLKKEK